MTMSASRQSSWSAAGCRISATIFPFTVPMQPSKSHLKASLEAAPASRPSPPVNSQLSTL